MKTPETYRSGAQYCTGNNCKFEHVLKENGKINFSAPPEGYRYTAMPIDEKTIRDWALDPMFVTKHRIGTKEMLCYMELVETKASFKIEQPYKSQNTKENRRRRCRIISEKTGREIMCPYGKDHTCIGCENAGKFDTRNSVPLSLDALFLSEDGAETFDVPAPDNTEAEVEEALTRERVFARLEELDSKKRGKNQRAMHVEIYKLWVDGYTFMDISRELNIPKSGLHDDLLRIAKIVKEEME
ncbi:MAG: hypothetical protein IJ106_01450 [Parasporobacterium sp.]|nr:hypothetical protein [Parasporobacterium sp.]MBQ9613677.1 hypothetical protein [Lachnospiraceae bacterium]